MSKVNRVAYRAQQVIVDAVKPNSPPMITLTIQKIELDEDGKILSIIDQRDRIYKKAEDIIEESISFSDPITGFEGKISIAGLEQVLRIFANNWTSDKYSLELDVTTGWATDYRL